MSISRQPLTTSYFGAEVALPSGATSIEVWAVDADPATAMVGMWLRLSAQDGSPNVEILIPAGSTYNTKLKPGLRWTYNLKSLAGTAEGMVVIS